MQQSMQEQPLQVRTRSQSTQPLLELTDFVHKRRDTSQGKRAL